MEPARDQPDDAIELEDYQIGPTPQWSRPLDGPDDAAIDTLIAYAHIQPQWSRPVEGRMTEHVVFIEPTQQGLQWSRPMDGRITTPVSSCVPRGVVPQWSRPWTGRLT